MEAFFLRRRMSDGFSFMLYHIIGMDDVELHAGKVELAQFRFDLGRIATSRTCRS